MHSFHLSTAKRRNLFAFRGAKADTLNYHVRALGRRGVLIAGKVIAKTGFLVTFLLSTNGIKATGFQPVRFSVMYYNLPSHF